MSAERQAIIWLGLLALAVAFVAVFSGIMLPFLAGLILAYFLDPLVDALERRGVGRLWATLILMLLVTLVAVLALVIVVPLLISQARDLTANLPALLAGLRDLAEQATTQFLGQSFEGLQRALSAELGKFSNTGAELLAGIVASIWSGGLAVVNFVSLLLITPVITFYVLLDWDRMIAKIDGWLPRDHAPTIRRLASEIDEVLAGFIRGQGTVALLLGLMYAVGLSLVGLKYGLLVGLLAGIISFVPFVGSLVGFIVGLLLAVTQFWPDIWPIAMVVAVFGIGQAIEGNILSPKIVGDRIRLHPVWIIFSLFAFSYLLGVVGLLIAVPVAAVIGVVARFAISEYERSALFAGKGKGEGQGAAQNAVPAGAAASASGAQPVAHGPAPKTENRRGGKPARRKA